jgi:hypothetical protein
MIIHRLYMKRLVGPSQWGFKGAWNHWRRLMHVSSLGTAFGHPGGTPTAGANDIRLTQHNMWSISQQYHANLATMKVMRAAFGTDVARYRVVDS